MLMLPEPLALALEAAGVRKKDGGGGERDGKRVIYLSPSGRPFDQAMAEEFAGERELVLLCGRYEGIDQRVIDLYIDDEVSVGDYVLSSGEVAALAIIDASCRLVEKVITAESLDEESFSGGLLEYPQYTRPEIFDTIKVPDVLISGHHENIRRWRLEKRVEKTLRYRPDLIRRGRETGLFNREINSIIDRQVQAEGDSENE
ncbi:MAG: tRNA (guanosine(37)-N1)-methyltransferase TrmD, partial [Treponema sp.]|nr:tRNA (guanosine(37)-N1)-methyltransferase TrmD [Treponema sp.]